MGLVLLFAGQQGAANQHYGVVDSPFTFGRVTQAGVPVARVDLQITFGRLTRWTYDQPATVLQPEIVYEVAFASQPLDSDPDWVDLSDKLRAISSKRGRSYEFDRMETGTMDADLSNRDASLSPNNSASPYSPIRSTRPVRAFLSYDQSYPLFRGISEGFPQTYIAQGKDAVVALQANDNFYGITNARFTPGSTTLLDDVPKSDPGTSETISVRSTELPMPQVAPFEITLVGDDPLTSETVTVTEILGTQEYQVTRGETTWEHAGAAFGERVGDSVTTNAVSFGEALSGERIRQVLEALGFTSSWYDLDEGQSLISPSEDLASVSPLEHLNLVAEAEFGRFFVARDGKFTFRDRHATILDHLSPVFTFTDGAVTTAGEVPFTLDGEVSHTEDKLYNRVKITIQGGDYDGQVVDVSDSASIEEHFERVYEKTLPYANPNDAESAAIHVLTSSAEAKFRLPGISVKGAKDPGNLWPLLLAREIGDRVRFQYQPEAGGDEIDQELTIEGIAHAKRPGEHIVTFQCSEAPSTAYWILGTATYGELGETTWLAF